jgi:serine/threonine-protein kinase
VLNSYVLIEPIGAGATGTVWRALDRVRGEQVAVKILREDVMSRPKAVTRFVQERAILLMLRHDNIVGVRDLLTVDRSLGLVMDLIEGGSLRERLRDRGTLPTAEVATLLCGVAEALACAHAVGVVHRDLKPDNILLDSTTEPAGRARLTDFGIAQVLDSPRLTTTGALLGTPSYMAPETINGARPTSAVDVYALGILLYELIVGRHPYAGDTPVAVLHRHLASEPCRPPGVPDAAWRVIEACTAKNPRQRPTATSLVSTLRSLAGSTGDVPALPPPDDTDTPAAHSGGPTGAAARHRRGRGGSGPGGRALRAGDWMSARLRIPRRWLWWLATGTTISLLVGGLPVWHLLEQDRRSPAGAAAPSSVGPDAPAPASRAPTSTAVPRTSAARVPMSEAGGGSRPEATTGPMLGASVRAGVSVFGPLQCTETYVWDFGHPLLAKPCYATGPAARISARMRAVPGVQADISLTIEDAVTGATVAGPYTCPGVMFTDTAPERSCGPFDAWPRQGRDYVVVQKWQYTGRGMLPGGTARGKTFHW